MICAQCIFMTCTNVIHDKLVLFFLIYHWQNCTTVSAHLKHTFSFISVYNDGKLNPICLIAPCKWCASPEWIIQHQRFISLTWQHLSKLAYVRHSEVFVFFLWPLVQLHFTPTSHFHLVRGSKCKIFISLLCCLDKSHDRNSKDPLTQANCWRHAKHKCCRQTGQVQVLNKLYIIVLFTRVFKTTSWIYTQCTSKCNGGEPTNIKWMPDVWQKKSCWHHWPKVRMGRLIGYCRKATVTVVIKS